MCRIEGGGTQPAMEIGWHACQARQFAVPRETAIERGESVQWDGQTLQPEMVYAHPKTRCYIYSSDTRPCQTLRDAAADATVLYHDATFNDSDADRAKATHHSTTIEAGRLARQAGVGTWFSDTSACVTGTSMPSVRGSVGTSKCCCGRGWDGHSRWFLTVGFSKLSLGRIILNKPSLTHVAHPRHCGQQRPLFRLGVRNMTRQIDGIDVIGEASSGEDLIGLVQSFKPTVVVVDFLSSGFDIDVVEGSRQRGHVQGSLPSRPSRVDTRS